MERKRKIKRPEKKKQIGFWGKGNTKAIPGVLRGTRKGTKKKKSKREMKRKRKKTDPREAHKSIVRAVPRTREGSAGKCY